MPLSDVADAAFAPAARAVTAGAFPGATLGLITAEGERALVS
ncbi:MAG TPA: esterase, partial [Sphingomonas bacterium]|nr:esterase [Sphingomonas bacterium]